MTRGTFRDSCKQNKIYYLLIFFLISLEFFHEFSICLLPSPFSFRRFPYSHFVSLFTFSSVIREGGARLSLPPFGICPMYFSCIPYSFLSYCHSRICVRYIRMLLSRSKAAIYSFVLPFWGSRNLFARVRYVISSVIISSLIFSKILGFLYNNSYFRLCVYIVHCR